MAKKLFFGNLPFSVDSAKLQEACAKFGTVVSAEVITDKFNNNRSKGFGFVEMSTDEEAQAVITALNEKDFEGRTIYVNEARPKEDRGDKPRRNFDRPRRDSY